MIVSTDWYGNHSTLIAVAAHAIDQGELTTANDVLAFFEKPWHYPELHDAWQAHDEVNDE